MIKLRKVPSLIGNIAWSICVPNNHSHPTLLIRALAKALMGIGTGISGYRQGQDLFLQAARPGRGRRSDLLPRNGEISSPQSWAGERRGGETCSGHSATAAVYYKPKAYDASRPRLMGRHAAGESFLKGFGAHAEVNRIYCYAESRETHADGDLLALFPGDRARLMHCTLGWLAKYGLVRIAEGVATSGPRRS